MVCEGMLKQNAYGYATGRKDSKLTDIQELKYSMEASIEYFKKNRNTLSKADEIAEAIINETISYIDSGIDPVNFVFTYKEIYELVWGKAETPEKASQAVRGHKEKLDAVLAMNSGLNLFLAAQKLQQLKLNIQATSGHHKTNISIVTNQTELSGAKVANCDSVLYVATMLPKPYRWTKPFLKLALKMNRIIFTVILVISIWLTAFGYIFFFSDMNEVSKFFSMILFILATYTFLKFSELMAKGLTSTPIFMIPLRTSNVFFILQRSMRDHKRGLDSATVVFEGQCGICGDKLIIEKSYEFNGRYVGKCAIAPKEHIFSFDHVTKIGKNLRR
jgi:hypothetical protein